jgi:hypothetical protein
LVEYDAIWRCGGVGGEFRIGGGGEAGVVVDVVTVMGWWW